MFEYGAAAQPLAGRIPGRTPSLPKRVLLAPFRPFVLHDAGPGRSGMEQVTTHAAFWRSCQTAASRLALLRPICCNLFSKEE
jgi:hypothetical protein